MQVLEVPNIQTYKIVDPNYEQLLVVLRRFVQEKGLEDYRPPVYVAFDQYIQMVAWLFKQGEQHEGLVNDYLTFLRILGIPFQPYIVSSK